MNKYTSETSVYRQWLYGYESIMLSIKEWGGLMQATPKNLIWRRNGFYNYLGNSQFIFGRWQ